jgi:hypothetical protein
MKQGLRVLCLLVSVFLVGCSSGQATPTSTGAAGGGGGSGRPPSAGESVAYGIYVGGVYTGGPCGPYTNSGYFSTLDFDSVFHNIVFARPTTAGVPGPVGGLRKTDSDLKAAMPNLQVTGEGKVALYTLCPMYETETDSYPCKVTDGPNDFPVHVSIVAPQGAGGSATIKFETGSTEAGKPIMRWDGQIGTGEWGGAGGGEVAFFTTTWDQLMRGEEFAFEYTAPGNDGDSWRWSIRFMAEGAS